MDSCRFIRTKVILLYFRHHNQRRYNFSREEFDQYAPAAWWYRTECVSKSTSAAKEDETRSCSEWSTDRGHLHMTTDAHQLETFSQDVNIFWCAFYKKNVRYAPPIEFPRTER
jgi:hypothetical protein